jgi:hypothetical protein
LARFQNFFPLPATPFHPAAQNNAQFQREMHVVNKAFLGMQIFCAKGDNGLIRGNRHVHPVDMQRLNSLFHGCRSAILLVLYNFLRQIIHAGRLELQDSSGTVLIRKR